MAGGFVLVLAGAVLPFLMVIGVLPSTFTLCIISYACSVGGLFSGVVGMAYAAQRARDGADGPDLPSVEGLSGAPGPR